MSQQIKNLLKKTTEIKDEELNSHFLNYVCVLISGYLETELNTVIKEYKTSGHYKKHECMKNIESMRKIQNAKWCSVRPIFMNIDDSILKNLKESIKDFEQIISSIDNITNSRHKIAHGKDVTHLTKNILVADLDNIDSFIDKLQAIFKNL